jgi:TonB family protein
MLRSKAVTRPLCTAVVLVFAFIAPSYLQAGGELERHLRDEYNNKTLVLRTFYHGDRLRYDSGGALAGSAEPGDWTVDGFIRVTALSLSDRHLTIKAERLALGNCGKGCGFRQYFDKQKPDKRAESEKRVRIEVDSVGMTAEKADAALSRIFLNSQDRLANLVPDYWQPCVLAAATGKGKEQYTDCLFAPEFAAVPGLVSNSKSKESPQSGDTSDEEGKSSSGPVHRMSKGVTAPKTVYAPDPDFSEQARRAKYQGTVMLSIIVDKSGQVRNIRVWQPLGLGLDRKAVEAVSKWRFKPAIKEGEPVDMELAVEVDFHLY